MLTKSAKYEGNEISGHKVKVVIPVYKSFKALNDYEKASLKHNIKILKGYSICFVGPASLDFTEYIFEAGPTLTVDVESFESAYFNSIGGYNKLMINPRFYERFKKWEYILICQPDAWVFRDELADWCNKRYDYIGAPWFEGWDNATPASEFIGVGNGGFSLRNVQAHLRVLNSFSYINKPWPLIKNFLKCPTPGTLKSLILDLSIRNNTHKRFNNYKDQEDWFWGLVAAKNFKWFRIPDMTTALKFSIEVNPHVYIKSREDLPFGCHAWWKYEPHFWKAYIPFSDKGHNGLAI